MVGIFFEERVDQLERLFLSLVLEQGLDLQVLRGRIRRIHGIDPLEGLQRIGFVTHPDLNRCQRQTGFDDFQEDILPILAGLGYPTFQLTTTTFVE